MAKHIPKSRKKSKKVHKRIKPIKKRVYIENPNLVEQAVIDCVRENVLTPTHLAKKVGWYPDTARDFVQDFQLYQLNKNVREHWKMNQNNMNYLFPTVAQFRPAQQNLIAIHIMKFNRGSIVKRNQLCRWFSDPEELIIKGGLLQNRLNIDYGTCKKWMSELVDAVETQDHKKMLNFAEKCGIKQQSEFLGGSVQVVIWTYFCTENPKIAYDLASIKSGSKDGTIPIFKNLLTKDLEGQEITLPILVVSATNLRKAYYKKLKDATSIEAMKELVQLGKEHDFHVDLIQAHITLPPRIRTWVLNKIRDFDILKNFNVN